MRRPPAGGALVEGKVMRGIDDTDMRKGLREIAEEPPRARIEFLGKQPDIVANG